MNVLQEILRGYFDPQILPNSKKCSIRMQRSLLDIHFMMSLKKLTQNFLELGKVCESKFRRKIKSL